MRRGTWLNVYLILSGGIFFFVAVLHLLRLLYHWPIVVGTQSVPMWLSYVGFPAASGYCAFAFWLLRSRKPAFV